MVNNTKSIHTKRDVIDPETGEIQSFTLNQRCREFVRDSDRDQSVRNTTIFTAKPGGESSDKPLKNQQVKEVIDPETGELFRYTYCEKRQDWSKGFDFDESAKMADFLGSAPCIYT